MPYDPNLRKRLGGSEDLTPATGYFGIPAETEGDAPAPAPAADYEIKVSDNQLDYAWSLIDGSQHEELRDFIAEESPETEEKLFVDHIGERLSDSRLSEEVSVTLNLAGFQIRCSLATPRNGFWLYKVGTTDSVTGDPLLENYETVSLLKSADATFFGIQARTDSGAPNRVFYNTIRSYATELLARVVKQGRDKNDEPHWAVAGCYAPDRLKDRRYLKEDGTVGTERLYTVGTGSQRLGFSPSLPGRHFQENDGTIPPPDATSFEFREYLDNDRSPAAAGHGYIELIDTRVAPEPDFVFTHNLALAVPESREEGLDFRYHGSSEVVNYEPSRIAEWEPYRGPASPPGFKGDVEGTDGDAYHEYVPAITGRLEVGPLPAFDITSVEILYDPRDNDGKPPAVTPKPDQQPIGGGPFAQIGGPSGGNFQVPLGPGTLPLPGDPFDFTPPGFPSGFDPIRMPIQDFNLPEMPPFGCNMPDLGNFSDCPPNPGTGGPLPGGLGPDGKPIPGGGGIRTGPPGSSARREKFSKQRCYDNERAQVAIRALGNELGLDENTLLFEEPCNKRFSKCFPKGSSKFDAMWWISDNVCGHSLIDDGDGPIKIGPVKPLPTTWTFNEDVDLFTLERNYSDLDVYHAVEVFWPGTRKIPVKDFVNGPYPVSTDDILQIEVGPEITREMAEGLAARKAAQSRRSALSVKCAVPYDLRRKLRHQIVIQRPTRGFEELLMITKHEGDFSSEGNLHILTASLI